MEYKQFWMVYAPGHGYPTREHHSYQSASAEAERIAKKGSSLVYILKPTSACSLKEQPVQWHLLDFKEKNNE